MAFTPRLSAPSYSSAYYYKNNPFYQSGYGMPNCTCYAFGRSYEILGKKPTLSLRNAENWWGNTADGYERGQTPRLGAVICWRGGKVGYSSDGAGHVGVVEQIIGNQIVVSMSAWKGTRWFTKTFNIGSYNYSGLTFQGFIYNPAVPKEEAVVTPNYAVGQTLTLQANMKVRTGAGTSYRWKKRNELTADGQKHAQSQTHAVLKTGTRVSVLQVTKSGSDVWVRIPSGWVCAKLGNSIYAR